MTLQTDLANIELRVGHRLFYYQVGAMTAAYQMFSQTQVRRCLYYKTGAGKTLTALGDLYVCDYRSAVVIAPPSTHPAWEEKAAQLSMNVKCMSHAKFREPHTKMDRNVPVIADEFHLFGGHRGKGFSKLQRLARGLQAPVILASATPNYNDIERCFCVASILDPDFTKGGFLEFIYRHCTTEQNPFGETPIVTGFRHYKDAADFLSSMDMVDYLPDDLQYSIDNIPVYSVMPNVFVEYGYDERNHRIMASDIERRHVEAFQRLVGSNGLLRPSVEGVIRALRTNRNGPLLLFANHATVAEAAFRTLEAHDVGRYGLVTGKTSKKKKLEIIQSFRNGEYNALIGTAALATGTDGLDRVCNTLLILDDTDDDSLRRQLVGRIMPRGGVGNVADKQVHRITT